MVDVHVFAVPELLQVLIFAVYVEMCGVTRFQLCVVWAEWACEHLWGWCRCLLCLSVVVVMDELTELFVVVD